MEKKSTPGEEDYDYDSDRERSNSISEAKPSKPTMQARRKRSSIQNGTFDMYDQDSVRSEAIEHSRSNSISEAKIPFTDLQPDEAKGNNTAPTIQSLQTMSGGYNQTYLIMKPGKKDDVREVFFRCGQWCYKGDIEFFGVPIGTSELPTIIPNLQRQQGRMRYFCPSKSVPHDSEYYAPLNFIEEAIEFIGTEIVSERVEKELKKWSSIFKWIQEDTAKTYFELISEAPSTVTNNVDLIATKTYNYGLIIISIFYQNAIYFVLQDGEGDQPLLDVSFPNVSTHGQGLLISNYYDPSCRWKKMTLWHNLDVRRTTAVKAESKSLEDRSAIKTPSVVSVASKEYTQTYCIKRSDENELAASSHLSSLHEVLFRFGNWCYSGKVQLIPTMIISDIPYVIPALRMQQAKLSFLCDTSHIPDNNIFLPALQYIQRISPMIEKQIAESEGTLMSLIDRLTSMGVGDSVSKWLQGDAANSFFEFKVSPDDPLHKIFEQIELIASKSYHAGVITITVIFQHTIFVSVQEVSEDNPLLDSRFPDVSGKGRGYQLQTYDNGIEGWPALRKVSVWQTVTALETEFRERTAAILHSQSKGEEPEVVTEADKAETGVTATDAKHLSHSHPVLDGHLSRDKAENKHEASPQVEEVSSDAKGEDVENSTPTKVSSGPTQFISALSAGDLLRSSSSPIAISRPHHLPKMEPLSKKVEELRRALDQEGEIAPWDGLGKPHGRNKTKK